MMYILGLSLSFFLGAIYMTIKIYDHLISDKKFEFNGKIYILKEFKEEGEKNEH